MKLHEAGELAGARARYREALARDPGHLAARYNLGRALARGGELEAALEVLAQLRAAKCPECQERILAAASDDDWAPARARARYRELTAGVEDELATVEQAAELARAWLEDPLANAAPPQLSPRHAVAAEILCTTCDPEDAGPGGDDIRDRPRGAEAVTRWYRAVHRQAREHRGLVIGEALRCRKGCCQFKRDDAEQDEDGEERLRRNTLYLERVCFKTLGERALWIKRLSFLDGG
ncbi:MAG: tetratricopeptide repeat protein [Myxococcales bacterium]|nr:tetratricopeptide repeat protein [Myxococcales bacterium]